MRTTLDLRARAPQVVGELRRALTRPGGDLAPALLAVSLVEYPGVDVSRWLRTIDRMGEQAAARIAPRSSLEEAVHILNDFVYDEMGFRGNRDHYDDPRNSYLNEVLERRTGIPIALAAVYVEVARRAGLRADGVNFPGHFLVRLSPSVEHPCDGDEPFLILDPFHAGTILDASDCEQLYHEHGGDGELDERLLTPATRPQIISRSLTNLKRLYVRMRSFPQARLITDLLLAVDPSAVSELRDRGLLAYHLDDFAAALRDLENYLQFRPSRQRDIGSGDAAESEDDQLREQVQALRLRVATLN
jgi:regulator of sirC expression with transglutaminase-like and TPR domain